MPSSPVSEKKFVPFSECNVWQKQQEFYVENSIKAWNGKLPFYATSNPYIADSYVQIIIKYMQEIAKAETFALNEPIYIMELGAGTGAFSFYAVKRLLELQKMLKLEGIQWKYIMTDIVPDNIKFWETQPNLKPYIEQGLIDFSAYQAEQPQPIYLLKSKILLTQEQLKNPLIVIANYVLDSLRHDFWRVTQGQLSMALFNHDLQFNADMNNLPVDLSNVDPEFYYTNMELPYYKNQAIDAVLQHYLDNFNDISFIFPIGPLKCLEQLYQLANGQMLVLITDKGYTHHDSYHQIYEPEMVLHNGAFSSIVNFYALQYYAMTLQGDFFIENSYYDLNTIVLMFGNNFNSLTETQMTVCNQLERLNPATLLYLQNFISQQQKFADPKILFACLQSSLWSNHVFNANLETMIEVIKQWKHPIEQDILHVLDKVAANFYFTPWTVDVFFNIGLLLQETRHYKAAISYYYKSIDYFGRLPKQLHKLASCYYELGQLKQAQGVWEEILHLDEYDTLAAGKLLHLKHIKFQS
jgi:tetratricopeptide (TPR) repeat protein